MKVIIIIPTYNENNNIEELLFKIKSLEMKCNLDILIIDDASPDGTAKTVKNLMENDINLYIMERKGKLGLGTAYIHGFKWGLNKGYNYLFEMDADFSHPYKKLPELYKACAVDGADLSIGSRYVKGGGIENWPWNRLFLSYFASLYVRLIFWWGIKDTTAGFMCYTRKVLETIDLDNIEFVGYAFQIEMKYTAKKLGFKLVEVPIIFTDRLHGQSKMNGSIIKEALFGVLKLRFKKYIPVKSK